MRTNTEYLNWLIRVNPHLADDYRRDAEKGLI